MIRVWIGGALGPWFMKCSVATHPSIAPTRTKCCRTESIKTSKCTSFSPQTCKIYYLASWIEILHVGSKMHKISSVTSGSAKSTGMISWRRRWLHHLSRWLDRMTTVETSIRCFCKKALEKPCPWWTCSLSPPDRETISLTSPISLGRTACTCPLRQMEQIS
jgi:hypothetical protein